MALYILFMLTTAITSCILLLSPVLDGLGDEQPLNPLVQNKVLTFLVFGAISAIIAPIMFVACLIPSSNKTFQETLLKQLKD